MKLEIILLWSCKPSLWFDFGSSIYQIVHEISAKYAFHFFNWLHEIKYQNSQVGFHKRRNSCASLEFNKKTQIHELSRYVISDQIIPI